MHALIDEAKRIPSFERIVFSGGECFLLGADLDMLVAHAHRAGFATRAISNGYWAIHDRAARERMRSLRAAGLDEIMLSTGTFHQRFVSPTRIVNAARAAASAGISVRVSVEVCDQSTYDAASLIDDLADLVATGSVCVAQDPWIADAGGRGSTTLTHDRVPAEQQASANGRCAQIFTIVTVTPDQILTACCGFPTEELPSLRIGSIENRALDDVLRDAPNELFKMWLHVSGPAEIAGFVARYVPGYKLPPAASICQVCVALQRDSTAMNVVAEHGGDVVQEITAAFVRLQTHHSSTAFLR
jgi:hypothetical protein